MSEKLWSIGEVCQATGLTSRTLRHYDDLALLKPAKTRNRIRYYSQDQLLILQQILVYRELGFGLPEIAKLIRGGQDRELFDRQIENLSKEIKRLQQMLEAVQITKLRIENGENLVIDESFEGFDNDPYAEEAQARWPEQYAESQRRVAKLSKAQMAEIMQQHTSAAEALAELYKAGAKVTDAEVQTQIANHYNWICNFWTPSREAYVNLGRMYVADERFKKNYDKYADGLAQFVCEAIEVSGLGV